MKKDGKPSLAHRESAEQRQACEFRKRARQSARRIKAGLFEPAAVLRESLRMLAEDKMLDVTTVLRMLVALHATSNLNAPEIKRLADFLLDVSESLWE